MKNKETYCGMAVEDIFQIIIVITICIIGIIFFYNLSKNEKEEECVRYYSSNNGYILESCKCYEDKLKDIEIRKD